jgi:glycosyltransferase involved in cell wall biosynthesis
MGERMAPAGAVRARAVDVAMTIQAYAPTVGGGELQLERVLPFLARRNVHGRVYTRAVRGTPHRDHVTGTPVYRSRVAGESPFAAMVYIVESFGDIVRHWRATDVVHAHGALSPATIALAARVLGKPCVVTILGAGPPGDLARLRHKPIGRLRLGLMARRSHFIALSAEVVSELQAAGVPATSITLVPNGVDLTRYTPPTPGERAALRAELGLEGSRPYGVFVGRLHPVKSVDTLVRAVARTRDLHLVIVGDGQERRALESLAQREQVAGRVRFAGESDRVDRWLKAGDMFLLPSLGEGMPNALLEAMACGLACAASSSVGGVHELLGTTHGLTVPVGDVDAWAETMRRLAQDTSLRRALGDAAASRIRTAYSIDATADRLAALYRDLTHA